MAVLSIDQVLSGAQLGLTWGPDDLLVADIGGRRVLYALSRADGAIAEVTIAADGTLTAVGSLTLSGSFAVGSTPALALEAGGTPQLALAGMSPGNGAFVSLDGTGGLASQVTEPALPQLVAPTSFALGGGTAWVTGVAGGAGLELYLDTGGGFGLAGSVSDTSDAYLADVVALTHVSIGGANFVITASATENGVSTVAVASNGAMTVSGALGAADGLPINLPSQIDVIQRLGETLVIVGASGTSSLSSLTMDAAGGLQLADHVLDDLSTRFQQAPAMSAAQVGDFAFVAVGGIDGGVSLFTALPGGRFVHLDSVVDDGSTTLLRVASIATTITATRLTILASSAWESGMTRIGYDIASLGAVLVATGGGLSGSGLDDQLIGSDTSDVLNAGAGDDILLDGHGQDTLSGGDGADLFVFVADGVADVVNDFEKGVDRLDLSAFDFLYDVSQLTVTPTADGAVLSFQEETITVTTSDLSPLTAGELTNAYILNVNRPPILPVNNAITGGAGADTLNGGIGNDTIDGAAGDDVLNGFGGADLIFGGDGFDLIDGGEGADTLNGDTAPDTLIGGGGDDLITGGAGGDVIYGDDMV